MKTGATIRVLDVKTPRLPTHFVSNGRVDAKVKCPFCEAGFPKRFVRQVRDEQTGGVKIFSCPEATAKKLGLME